VAREGENYERESSHSDYDERYVQRQDKTRFLALVKFREQKLNFVSVQYGQRLQWYYIQAIFKGKLKK
jgi:hypothetical protein